MKVVNKTHEFPQEVGKSCRRSGIKFSATGRAQQEPKSRMSRRVCMFQATGQINSIFQSFFSKCNTIVAFCRGM